ncbi:uncharacterized protein F5Z01DRAFT_733031 [Emericellopsis atlantica]|uniref:Uncharacterized protein n=1 Tax=Emericellopsis atlantica TaxID=2614577 RepID=A0A9P7ZVD4_9HYPO|nr:uncharacterized protein F5Z01DRAFT_733031 [Emericellopsis atlantica]KAG9258410.1 hypothetical protein F5Z01DRAFT_733031 [Emericellopsis atlantica]
MRVIAVSINNVDGKAADMSPQIGAASGTEFSGIIAALGSHVVSDVWREDKGMRPVKVGAHAFGVTFGNNPLRPRNGAFADYVACAQTLDLAHARGAALATVGLPLFNYMYLELQPLLHFTIESKSFTHMSEVK